MKFVSSDLDRSQLFTQAAATSQPKQSTPSSAQKLDKRKDIQHFFSQSKAKETQEIKTSESDRVEHPTTELQPCRSAADGPCKSAEPSTKLGEKSFFRKFLKRTSTESRSSEAIAESNEENEEKNEVVNKKSFFSKYLEEKRLNSDCSLDSNDVVDSFPTSHDEEITVKKEVESKERLPAIMKISTVDDRSRDSVYSDSEVDKFDPSIIECLPVHIRNEVQQFKSTLRQKQKSTKSSGIFKFFSKSEKSDIIVGNSSNDSNIVVVNSDDSDGEISRQTKSVHSCSNDRAEPTGASEISRYFVKKTADNSASCAVEGSSNKSALVKTPDCDSDSDKSDDSKCFRYENLNDISDENPSDHKTSEPPSNEDLVACDRCGRQILVWDLPEHSDYHMALDLQNQASHTVPPRSLPTSSPIKFGKRKQSTVNKGKKKAKIEKPRSSLDKFFKPNPGS